MPLKKWKNPLRKREKGREILHIFLEHVKVKLTALNFKKR